MIFVLLWTLTKKVTLPNRAFLQISFSWTFIILSMQLDSNLVNPLTEGQNLMYGIKLYHFGMAYKIGLLGVGFIGRLSIYPARSAGFRRAKLDLFYIRPLCTLYMACTCTEIVYKTPTCQSGMRDLIWLSSRHLPASWGLARGGW